MSTILTHFKTLTQLPHCSQDATKLLAFLVDFAKDRGYRTLVDDAGNILLSKGTPTLCLQAHYDMVCMGKAPQIETYEEEGWLYAKNASLGADNGMAIAMMMQLMDEGREIECLLTSDEEIGLIGANAVAFDLQSRFMLNLDSEEEGEVYIGCAGGVDIVASKQDSYRKAEGVCYEVAVKGLMGGHSGVDIDKGIESAIKVLGEYLVTHHITQLASLYAGERRNAIASNAVAIVYSQEVLTSQGEVTVRRLLERPLILSEGHRVIEMIANFKQGVHAYNHTMEIPEVSINLAIITTDEQGGISVESSARAMSAEGLAHLFDETVAFFESYGLEVSLEDKYPAWRPDISAFTHLVSEEMQEVFGSSRLKAIHAGLECGVIAQKYPQITFASIGPTIRYPHSTREAVKLDSVERTFSVVERIIKRLG